MPQALGHVATPGAADERPVADGGVLESAARRDEIEAKHQAALERAARRVKPNRPLLEILSDAHDEEDDQVASAVCHL
jgi:hypothetical protein